MPVRRCRRGRPDRTGALSRPSARQDQLIVEGSGPRAPEPGDGVAFPCGARRWPPVPGRATALVPFNAGVRIAAVVRVDAWDVRAAGRAGRRGCAARTRRGAPCRPGQPRGMLATRAKQHRSRPGANGPALFRDRAG
jgi:hypothetical protein